MWRHGTRAGAAAMAAVVVSCSGGGGGGDGARPPIVDVGEYKVLAWNDLGMHGLKPTYDDLVILPRVGRSNLRLRPITGPTETARVDQGRS
jgi:hypothetical protein